MVQRPLKISLFYCSNSISFSELSKLNQSEEKFSIIPISLACSGRVNIQYLLKAIEIGADGVILVTCPHEACTYIEGNLRAKKRVMAVNSILKESGLYHEKLKIIQPDINDSPDQIAEKIIHTCNTIINVPQEGKITA